MQGRHLGKIFQRPNQVQHCFFVSSEEFLQATNAENLGARGLPAAKVLNPDFPSSNTDILTHFGEDIKTYTRHLRQSFHLRKSSSSFTSNPPRQLHNLNATGSRWLRRAPRRKSKKAINHQQSARQPGSAFPQRRSLEPRSSMRRSSDGNSCPIQAMQLRSWLCLAFLVLRLCW
jgi:hypothetical protein